MKKKSRKLHAVLFFLLLGSTLLSAYSKNIQVVLNLAEETGNIYTVLQSYAMLGTQLNYQSPTKEMHHSIEHYEATLKAMKEDFSDPEIGKYLAESQKNWTPIKAALLDALKHRNHGKMDKEEKMIHRNFCRLVQQLDGMMDRVLLLEHYPKSKELKAAIALGSSARSLSAHYVLGIWGVNDPAVARHRQSAFETFKRSLALLRHGVLSGDTAALDAMKKIEKNAFFIETLLRMKQGDTPVIVTQKCDEIQQEADKVVKALLDKTGS